MDYKEKYEQALERARELLSCCIDDRDRRTKIYRVEDIESIFPDLQESEDGRIRNWLIGYFHQYKENGMEKYANGLKVESIIAWLEKLGEIDLEHYKDGENEKRKFVGYGFLKCKGDFLSFKEGETYWLEYVGKDNYNVRSDNLLGQTFHIKPVELYTVFRPTTWLEKQGKEEYALKSFRDKDVHEFMQYIEKQAKAYEFNLPNRGYDIYAFAKDILYWLEKRGENKSDFSNIRIWKYIVDAVLTEENGIGQYLDSAHTEEIAKKLQKRFSNFKEQIKSDKTTPKFKVDDWIIQENIGVYKVIEVCESWYEVVDNKDKHYSISFDKEYMCHLWAIEGAKDGDVLTNWNNTTFIFKAIEDETVKFHIAYNEKLNTIKTPATKLSHQGLAKPEFEFNPATKEQRDILFAKMADAGYEWDSEKKELKKVNYKK